MRKSDALLIASLTLIPANVFAQKEQSTAVAPPHKAPQQFTVQDGGTREVPESIVIPPKAAAPFTLPLETEYAKALFDGGAITLVNKRRIARDSTGRIYREYWYSPQLGINILSIRSDPRFGKHTFTATNLIFSEPDPKLFELPEGYKVEDRRSSSPPEVN